MTGAAAVPLLLRVDAGPEIGLGHAVRVRHLLAAMGQPPLVAVIGRGGGLATAFPGQNVIDGGDVAAALAAAGRQAAACLADPYSFAADEWQALRELLLPTVLVDDFGGPFPADLIINGTALPEYHRYPDLAPGGRALCGPQYALLHPAYGRLIWRGHDGPRRVTVVVGGGARAVAWLRMLLDAGIADDWGEVCVVVGASFPLDESQRAAARGRGIELLQGLPSEALASRLAASTLMLATAGMVAYESLALGVPAVLFPQVESVVAEARWFAAQGCAIDLGFEGGLDAAAVRAAVGRLLADPRGAAEMSRRGRSIVDGQGLARAAAAVSGFLAALPS